MTTPPAKNHPWRKAAPRWTHNVQIVRLAFPALWEPKTVNGEGEPAFSACFLFGTDHPAAAALRAAFDVVGADKWGAKWPAVKKELELSPPDAAIVFDPHAAIALTVAGGEDSRLRSGPVQFQRQGRALREVPGRRAD